MMSPDLFLKEHLTKLLLGLTQLHVFAITYKDVSGFASGEIETGQPDLSLTVQTGNLVYSARSAQVSMMLLSNPELRNSSLGQALDNEVYDYMVSAASAVQSTVESSMSTVAVSDEVPIVAFIYVGASAFDQAVDYAVRFKATHPKAKVVTLNCDCNYPVRLEKLDSLVSSGAIDYALMNGECGGRTTMAKLIKSTTAMWQELETGRVRTRSLNQFYPITFGMNPEQSVTAILSAGVTSGEGSHRVTSFATYAGYFFNHLSQYLQAQLRETFVVTERDGNVLLTLS
jgi:hypothetical protein